MPSGKREAATFHQLAALAAAQPEEIRERRSAAETTYQNVLNRLGAAGTYDTPTEQPGVLGTEERTGGVEGEGEGGIFQTGKATSAAATGIDPRYTGKDAIQDIKKLDPKAYQKELEKSTQFRIQSRMTAESEQLLKREGPLWDEMIKNQQLPILEGASAMARENAEAFRREAAKGGAARRGAFETVQRIRAQERINTTKMQQLAGVRSNLDIWARENARTQLEFNQNWAANLGGIRESYNKAMDGASELMTSKAIPIMFAAKQEAAKWRYYAHAKQRNKVTRWISGILGVGAMLAGGKMGGAAGGQMMGAGGGAVGGAIFGGGPTPPTG